jgi:uncharacterized phosphatase
MHIFMMRHGQSSDNAHKLVSGDRETPLTELGKHQAKLAAKKAAGLTIDLIVCSPLGRAQQTAHIVANELGLPASSIVTVQELRERDLGELEGHSYAKNERLNGNFPAVDHIRGVEPLPYFYSRVQHALREIMHLPKHKTILIVCHFNVGRMLKVVVQGKKPHDLYSEQRLENGTIYPLA